MIGNRENEGVVRRLRAAVCAVLTVDGTDTPDWTMYQNSLKAGLKHLQGDIPPRGYPSVGMHEKDRGLWDRLVLTAAVPVSLFNRLLPYQRKLDFESLLAAYPDTELERMEVPFLLASYWHHDLMCGRAITSSLLEIWHENQFLTPKIREALQIIEVASRENRLSAAVLHDAIGGQSELVGDLIRACYLCMRHTSAVGIVREVETTGSNGFVLSTALILRALGQFNELEGNESSLSAEDSDCLIRIGQMTLALDRS